MNRAELIEIIGNGENSGVEFKLDDIRPEQLAKEVVSLANFRGGRILIGVADDGVIHGVERKNLEAWVMDTVFTRYVHPMMKQHNQTEPVFEATEDFLKTDLFRLKGHRDLKNDLLQTDNGSNKAQYDPITTGRDPLNDPLNEIQVQLLNALKTEPKADYATLARILDVSPATIKRNIQKLKNIGSLKRIGSKKTGYWEVIG